MPVLVMRTCSISDKPCLVHGCVSEVSHLLSWSLAAAQTSTGSSTCTQPTSGQCTSLRSDTRSHLLACSIGPRKELHVQVIQIGEVWGPPLSIRDSDVEGLINGALTGACGVALPARGSHRDLQAFRWSSRYYS